MTLTCSDDLVQTTGLSQKEIRQTVALALFAENKLTLAQAAQLAEMDRLVFQQLLCLRHNLRLNVDAVRNY